MAERLLHLIQEDLQDVFLYPPDALQGRLKEELLRSHRLQMPFVYIEVPTRHLNFFGGEKNSDSLIQAWKIAILTLFRALKPYDVVGYLPKGRGFGFMLVGFDLDHLERLKCQVLRNLRDAGFLDQILIQPKAPMYEVSLCTAAVESVHQELVHKMKIFNELSVGFVHVKPFLYSDLTANRWSPLTINWFKRGIDFSVALVMLLLLAPLFVWIALLIKLSDPKGPVFFCQTRVGMNGDLFEIWKFRSMYANASERLAQLKAQGLNEVDGPVFKMKHDPRVTGIGRILRRFSLDELPQFWNVLVGDMCLVGPRPPLPEEVREYLPWHKMRLSVKPGLTCLWQVSGRSHLAFEEWMRLDNQYVRHGGLIQDLDLMRRTVRVVVKGDGAY
jgi:lipopolysaccharide/colanic/teichoic acid biosynthesis glycosyltransferase